MSWISLSSLVGAGSPSKLSNSQNLRSASGMISEASSLRRRALRHAEFANVAGNLQAIMQILDHIDRLTHRRADQIAEIARAAFPSRKVGEQKPAIEFLDFHGVLAMDVAHRLGHPELLKRLDSTDVPNSD